MKLILSHTETETDVGGTIASLTRVPGTPILPLKANQH